MITGTSCSPSARAAESLFTARASTFDDESLLAATLRAAPAPDARTPGQRVVADILRNVESRLPGRVNGLRVVLTGEAFALHGVCSSYYVKQVAGHIAMTTIDARLPARLANEIEVRTVR